MLLNELKIIKLYCELDDFVKAFDEKLSTKLLESHIRKPIHHSGYKCFQYYYEQCIEKGTLRSWFPSAPCYNRFVQLKPRMLLYFVFYLNLCRIGMLCGIYFGDSTTWCVCNNRRIHNHKVFAGKAARGKSSTGWFFGFKFFLVINAFGEIMNAFVTPGNVADNNEKTMIRLFSKLKGWAFADKGFINQKAFEQLLGTGLHLVSGIRRNMKINSSIWSRNYC
ncbi:hypothetical protein A8C56_02675 [Niabella ginsenosidivorans]|uniref:Transposase DDE domain-containing protein n=1 Tax=Niabella ginsenosidivorans TaxID=1176587 RepID=A0A1A9HZ06_9BACT|nr:transposase [Niabella ginsenosidivorans]ANH80029.1 hypothetical protein A8C56_02675 [Niabella ginsenosidivorans]